MITILSEENEPIAYCNDASTAKIIIVALNAMTGCFYTFVDNSPKSYVYRVADNDSIVCINDRDNR